MGRKPQLLDQRGNPVQRPSLLAPTQTPRIGSFQAPRVGYPADGLTPQRLGTILKEADAGHANRYLELAEVIEERDLHYAGVLATRKRSVSQLDITVKQASDSPEDVQRADLLRSWIERDELQNELFNILDCLGKGISFTSIGWTKKNGKWWPGQLDYRDPKGFRFDKRDLQTPMELTESGKEIPLEPYRYIYARIQAKSGLPLRSGLARIVTWAYMFKKFTERDWAIFTQTYGQPLRVGKWQSGASEQDKDTLFKAVAQIAGDCAAIIPEGMSIDFVETKNTGASTDLYMKRGDWYDQQVSKAVIGQTATTDAVTGGLGSGKEHRQVQEDIERSDAKDLTAILNEHLVRPWMNLEYGVLQDYPKIIIGREEAEDLETLTSSLGVLVPLGMKVSMSEVREKFGLSEPKPDDELLGQNPGSVPNVEDATATMGEKRIIKRFSAAIKHLEARARGIAPQQTETGLKAALSGSDELEAIGAALADQARPGMEGVMDQLETMLAAANTLEELQQMLQAGFGDLDTSELEAVMGDAMTVAHAAGHLRGAETDEDA